MNEAPVAHHPKLIRTDFGFAITDGVQSFPVETFNEARDLAKLAATNGMEAVAEALFGPYDYEADYLAEVAAERAFAESLERRSERGTWFGSDPWGAEDY